MFPALSLGAGSAPGGGFEPITNLWDTDQYDGSAGTIGTAKGLTVGLAEYANSNYFSEDTIASTNPRHQFPFPSVNVADYHVCADDAPPGSRGLKRWYVSRVPCPPAGQPGAADHFLAESATRDVLGPLPHAITSAFTLDDKVMEDYARDLIPRAVGYSAALIDYFFRGQLEIEPVDPTHLRVINRSEETLMSGTIELFADTAAGDRTRLPEVYVLAGAIGPGESTPPIEVPPLADRPGQYTAVFRGTLGSEEQAVIGTSDFQWVEEWDQGLTGRHHWYQTTADPAEMSALPPGTVVRTTVSDGILTQENSRPAGTGPLRPGPGERPSAQVNQSYVGLTDFAPLNSPYRDVFPLRVTPKTDLVVKVDAMSINVPVAQCPDNTTVNGAYQHIGVIFDNGYFLELTVPNQQFNVLDNHNPVFIRLGEETRVNLYETLRARGVSLAQAPAIKLVMVVQQFLPPCEPTTEEQSQLLRVDYLRFVEQP